MTKEIEVIEGNKLIKKIDKYQRAAIVGFWRCGATVIEITANSGISSKKIREILQWYNSHQPDKSKINK